MKLKTRKGVAKRFKLSKKGKIKYSHGGRGHLLSKKKSKKKRQLRKPAWIKNNKNIKYIIRMLSYG